MGGRERQLIRQITTTNKYQKNKDHEEKSHTSAFLMVDIF
jgi:hypothetical protein